MGSNKKPDYLLVAVVTVAFPMLESSEFPEEMIEECLHKTIVGKLGADGPEMFRGKLIRVEGDRFRVEVVPDERESSEDS